MKLKHDSETLLKDAQSTNIGLEIHVRHCVFRYGEN
jgi:hypothetical protein